MAWLLCGKYAHPAHEDIYVAVNSYWDGLPFQPPRSSGGGRWKVVINTSMPPPEDIFDPGCEPLLRDQERIVVGGRSVAVLASERGAA